MDRGWQGVMVNKSFIVIYRRIYSIEAVAHLKQQQTGHRKMYEIYRLKHLKQNVQCINVQSGPITAHFHLLEVKLI